MRPKIDATHDPELTSWVDSANGTLTDFPIQNLPFGIFREKGSKAEPRGGVAIGDRIFDLAALGMKTGPNLNRLAAAGRPAWQSLRQLLSETLSNPKHAKKFSKSLIPIKQAELFLPVAIGDYSDFYTGIYHAENAGRMFRPDNPLLPNYHWVPIGYHGRASSVVVSGTPVVRPNGQTKAPDALAPSVGPSKRLDFELELGFVIGPGNALGKPVPISKAMDHVFGLTLFNDWSARDLQAWEYQPLGPFLAKSFASTMSPWIVTMEALAPFRTEAFKRAEGAPAPLPYLNDAADQKQGGYDIGMEIYLSTAKMRAQKVTPMRLAKSNFRHSYWTLAQVVTHQASNGCNMNPGDLLGSGTISGPAKESLGSLLEITSGGKNPITLPSGETRTFLEDGDEIVQRSRCSRSGYASIGFGEARGVIKAAPKA